jgi:hypothetical protein
MERYPDSGAPHRDEAGGRLADRLPSLRASRNGRMAPPLGGRVLPRASDISKATRVA